MLPPFDWSRLKLLATVDERLVATSIAKVNVRTKRLAALICCKACELWRQWNIAILVGWECLIRE